MIIILPTKFIIILISILKDFFGTVSVKTDLLYFSRGVAKSHYISQDLKNTVKFYEFCQVLKVGQFFVLAISIKQYAIANYFQQTNRHNYIVALATSHITSFSQIFLNFLGPSEFLQ